MKEVLGPCRSRRSTCSRDLYHLHIRLASLPGYVAGVRCHEENGALPTSIRFLFYELLDRGVIRRITSRTARRACARPSQDIADTAKALREARLVPWSWIVDETRILYDWAYTGSVYQYVENTLPSARIDLWGGEPAPLILCESRSLAGVLRGAAATYLCPIAATN